MSVIDNLTKTFGETFIDEFLDTEEGKEAKLKLIKVVIKKYWPLLLVITISLLHSIYCLIKFVFKKRR